MVKLTPFQMGAYALAVAWVLTIASLEIVSFSTVDGWYKEKADSESGGSWGSDSGSMDTTNSSTNSSASRRLQTDQSGSWNPFEDIEDTVVSAMAGSSYSAKYFYGKGMHAWAIGSIATIFISVGALAIGLGANMHGQAKEIVDAFLCISGGTAVASLLFTTIEFTVAHMKVSTAYGAITTDWFGEDTEVIAVGVTLIFFKLMHVYVFLFSMLDRALHDRSATHAKVPSSSPP
jgi:hypothetical protein